MEENQAYINLEQFCEKFGYKVEDTLEMLREDREYRRWGFESTVPMFFSSYINLNARKHLRPSQILIGKESLRCNLPEDYFTGIKYIIQRNSSKDWKQPLRIEKPRLNNDIYRQYFKDNFSGYNGVYIIAVEFPKYGKLYKIGKSDTDISSRLMGMTIYPILPECIFIIRNTSIEEKLHRRFEHKRVVGEWFILDMDDLVYIYNKYSDIIKIGKDCPVEIDYA